MPIAADRYIEASAMGKFYSVLAKDALVTDITYFAGLNVIERRTTIRFIGKQGRASPGLGSNSPRGCEPATPNPGRLAR